MPVQEPLSLQLAVVDAMRRLRQRNGWSQDGLAEVARDLLGLSWTRSTVSDLEARPRRRDLSADEFVLLPGMLEVSEAELAENIIRHEDSMELLNAGRALRQWLARNLKEGSRERASYDDYSGIKDVRAALAADANRRAETLALRQTEKNVARALKADPIEVAKAALRLWGHGVTEERDRLVDETPGKGDRSRRLSHATRRLIPELRDELGGER